RLSGGGPWSESPRVAGVCPGRRDLVSLGLEPSSPPRSRAARSPCRARTAILARSSLGAGKVAWRSRLSALIPDRHGFGQSPSLQARSPPAGYLLRALRTSRARGTARSSRRPPRAGFRPPGDDARCPRSVASQIESRQPL